MTTLKADWTDWNSVGTPTPGVNQIPAATFNLIPAQVNTNTTAIAALQAAATARSFPVDSYGADPTGVAFSDTAVATAVAAIGNNPGVLEFGVGTYKLNTTVTLDLPGQGIKGQGAGLTSIDYRGTGDCFRVYDSTASYLNAFPSVGHAGPITGVAIDGASNANSNTVGLHIGDLYGIYIQDVRINGFDRSGCIGFWGDNLTSWSERACVQIQIDECTNGAVFGGTIPGWGQSSWDYGVFNLAFYGVPVNGNAVVVKNKTLMDGVDFHIDANCWPDATTNTGTVLTVGVDGSDTSRIRGQINLSAEVNTGDPVGHKTINIGAAANIWAYGRLEFYSPEFVAGTADATKIQFFGRVNCPGIGDMTVATDALHVVGYLNGVNGIKDEGGNLSIWLSATPSAVNYLQLSNGAAGGAVIMQSTSDTETTVNMGLATTGLGTYYFWDGDFKDILHVSPVTNSVNYLQIINAATGAAPSLAPLGTDSNISVNVVPKGTGRLQESGNTVGSWVSVPSTATSTGKKGQMAADSSFLYICTATNVWRRVAIASW